ncbi:MAG: hypothetical protein ACK53Y_02325, partial [bacterium]
VCRIRRRVPRSRRPSRRRLRPRAAHRAAGRAVSGGGRAPCARHPTRPRGARPRPEHGHRAAGARGLVSLRPHVHPQGVRRDSRPRAGRRSDHVLRRHAPSR